MPDPKSATPSFSDLVLDCLADAVFTADHECRITSFNRAAERTIGLDRQQALGRPCGEVLRAEGDEVQRMLRQVLRKGRPRSDNGVYVTCQDGSRLPISLSASPLRDSAGELLGCACSFRDLTGVLESYLSGSAGTPRDDLRRQLLQLDSFAGIISRSHQMRSIFAVLPDIARSPATVLIEGPSGAGKELFAKAIHDLSPRSRGPLVTVNCGAVPDNLLESELFGYKAGAFTDARRDKPGRFALARGGTLFLDEIGDVSPAMQTRLLRVLQDGVYQPLGSTRSEQADVRVVAATHRDLDRMVREGSFRLDLFYRLDIMRIAIPPLAQRKEDIPLLANHVSARLRVESGKQIRGLSEGALEALYRHDYPGNVRELENILERAWVLCDGERIERRHLPAQLLVPDTRGQGLLQASSLEELQARFLKKALADHGFKLGATAGALGMHRSTLWRKLKKLGVKARADDE